MSLLRKFRHKSVSVVVKYAIISVATVAVPEVELARFLLVGLFLWTTINTSSLRGEME